MHNLQEITAPWRGWAEVDLDALAHNYNVARTHASGRHTMPVIKANAYGHGAVQAARTLAEAGADFLAVATPQEALQLRRHHIALPILVLGAVPPGAVAELAQAGVSLSVASPEAARAYAGALPSGQNLQVHVKLDTGMGRLGLSTSDTDASVEAIRQIAALPGLLLQGVFTHFAVADEADGTPFTDAQVNAFAAVCSRLDAPGISLLRHCANSAGILAHPGAHMDLVRPGILLYGYDPRGGNPVGLRPVMALRTRIAQIKTVQAGDTVSYGRTWRANGPRVIATVPTGYADGLFRSLSGKLQMLVRGQRVPQVGRICMDMCMLDVTGVPDVQIGDIATVFGQDGSEQITAQDVACLAGTIPYEILCAVSTRVPRVYLRGTQVVEAACYLDSI